MNLFLAVRTTDGTTGTAGWEIRTGSTPGRARLFEIGFTIVAATASVVGLGRPAAIGVTPTSPVDFDPEDPNDVLATGVVQSALAWGTGPTIPAKFIRRISFPATIGSGVIWTFPKGLVIPVSSGLVLWNLAGNSVLDAYAAVSIGL
jgi:hypothetical protein